MNILHYGLRGKDILLYEDHRALLGVLFHALERGVLKQSPDLLFFDLHTDDRQPSAQAMETITRFRQNRPTCRDFFSFVEWDLAFTDDDWLLAGFELGLINNAVVVGARDKSGSGFSQFTDHVGEKHRTGWMNHIWSGLGYQGCLSDRARRDELASLWDFLGWTPLDGGCWAFRSEGEASRALILDFDLDCFTTVIGQADRTIAWPQDVLIHAFDRSPGELGAPGWTPRSWLQEVAGRSPFITIARESDCCGGTLESQDVLAALDHVLWDGDLMRR